MSGKKKEMGSAVARKSSLIAGRTGRMAFVYIGSTVCSATVTLINSLVAGISLGSDALAAIAAAGPLLALEQILHCMYGIGIDKLMVRSVGKGDRREANRIFGAVLIAVLILYLLVLVPILVFEQPLLSLFIKDEALVGMMIDYTLPQLALSPVFECLLCVERAFRVDGRARLLSKRGIVTNVTTILFDILFVSILGMDLSGLAWASVIGSALGYTLPLSHFFSKKRTVKPDFSVILSFREFLYYIKEDLRMGNPGTVDEIMDGIALGAQTAVVGIIGGSGGLAIWAVFKSLRGVVLSIANGASASVCVHTGLLYGQKDYEGVRYSVRESVKIALVTSVCTAVFVLVLPGLIADLHQIGAELRPLCVQCLRIGCAVFPALALLTVVCAYLPTVEKLGLTNTLVLIQKGLSIVAAAAAYYVGLQSFFAGYVLAVWTAAIVLIVLLIRDRHWFVPERNPETIGSYSIRLRSDWISALSVIVQEKLTGFSDAAEFNSRVALVLEDGLNYIAQQNPEKEINTDIEIKHAGDGVLMTIIDDGRAYSPLPELAREDPGKPGALEAAVVLGLSAEVNYDRVLDLNDLNLHVKPIAPGRSAE